LKEPTFNRTTPGIK